MDETFAVEDTRRSRSSHAHRSSSPGTVYPAIASVSAAARAAPSVPFASHASRNNPHARGKYPARAKSNSASVLEAPPSAKTTSFTSAASGALRGKNTRSVIVPPKNITPMTVIATTNHSMNSTTSIRSGSDAPSVSSTSRPLLNLFSARSGCSVRMSRSGLSAAPALLLMRSTKPATTTTKSSMFQ